MEDFERALEFINSHKWTFAKTMANIPHCYLVRAKISEKTEFDWFDDFIHRNGEIGFFGKKMYKYLYLNGYKYWDCFDQIHTTDLINRDEYKKTYKRNNIDVDLFSENNNADKDEEIIDIIKSIDFKSVLIPNCDDGRIFGILEHLNVKQEGVAITGVDNTKPNGMEMSGMRIYHDKMSHLYLGKYDLIIGTAAEKLDNYDIKRILSHKHPNTKILLFSDNDIEERCGLFAKKTNNQNILTNL